MGESIEQILEQLIAVLAAMHAVERSSARECVMRALSMLCLHYSRVEMWRIVKGVPLGVSIADERAAEEHMAPVVDDLVADLDLGEEEDN